MIFDRYKHRKVTIMYIGEHLFAEQMLKDYFSHPESILTSIEKMPPHKKVDIVLDAMGRKVEHIWARVKKGGIYVLQNSKDSGFAIRCASDLMKDKSDVGELDYESVTFHRGIVVIERKMRAFKK